ncbi:hypothetical protein O3M35_013238 [Rhynocoris fuscipes]|uniref:F-box domain-containing protein n=1 Tax=Rhynocoris fuscipes TaxID=488301 RepID=A0AAW1CFD2_9HEMI
MFEDEEEDYREPENQSPWTKLPDLIIEKIFSYLTMRERYYASMVCRRWHEAFYLPYAWHIFTFDERTLTRRRFNYYSGWQFTLDHLRAQLCLATIGRNFRVLVFKPMTNFYNMYEFMNMISYYAEQQGADRVTVKGIGENIKTLRYTFPCNMLARDESQQASRLYGTGGKLLEAVKRLMGNLKHLKRLELIDLMLDNSEAVTLLDDVCCECCTTLKYLSLLNFTKAKCHLLHVGVFLNLQVLVISPHNIGEEVVELLSNTKLRHLHLSQTRFSTDAVQPVPAKVWSNLKKRAPNLRVHLTLETKGDRQLMWQECAPVASILITSPHCKLEPLMLTRAVEWYRDTLELFGHIGIPRFHQAKSFNERLDPLLLMMTKECKHLNTLIIRERVSTATTILIAQHGKRLEKLYIRRNAVILKCDWPRNPSWTKDYHKWFKKTSKSYNLTEKEVAKFLRKSDWCMIEDKEFKHLSPNLY